MKAGERLWCRLRKGSRVPAQMGEDVGGEMSLVGNLEDLSLGDILQIISLSQKSGVLALIGDHGSGRIVFRQGLVQAARLKGRPNDLRELLTSGQSIAAARYDELRERSQDQGVPIEEMLAGEGELTAERIEILMRDAAEAAIFEMFSWAAGDFSFDVRIQLDPEDPQLILSTGLNAQYLAMEALRLRDERVRDGVEGVDPNALTNPGLDDPADDPIFGFDALETDDDPDDREAPDLAVEPILDVESIEAEPIELELLDEVAPAADVLVARVIERAEAADELELSIEPPVAVASPPSERVPSTTSPAETVAAVRPAAPPISADPASVCSAKTMPVVMIDPDVGVLEWVKASIEGDFARVHVFQQADQGLARIRQYLIRGEIPLVLISPATPIDPLSGIRGLGDFVKRLKTQAPRLVILGLREDEDAAPSAMPKTLDGVLRRPARPRPTERNSEEDVLAGRVLLRALLEILTQQAKSSQ